MKHLYQKELETIKAQKVKGEYIDTITLEKWIKEKRFTVKDIGVNYRWIDHWYYKGLLLSNYEEHKWKKFNLIEYIWLKMIIKMRAFNISLETVKYVKDFLESNITYQDLMNSNKKALMEIIPKFAPEGKEEVAKEILLKSEFQEKIEDMKINILEIIIIDCLVLGSCYSIMISSDGQMIPFKYTFLEYYSDIPEFKKFIRNSYISISITEILQDFIIEKSNCLTDNIILAILTAEELLVFNAIRRDDLKSVIVKFDKNGQINLLEEIKEEKPDKAVRLLELIMSRGYQDITIKTQNGEIVYCENKKKIMIQKKE